MMKRSFALLLCLLFLFPAGCAADVAEETTVSSAESMTTQSAETTTKEDVLSANDLFGNTAKKDGFSISDRSVLYRTDDSRSLEPIAVHAAQEMIKKTLAQPESLEIKNVTVSNCADDGTCVYYTFYFNTTSLVGSGERVRHAYYYDIGVHKADKSSFDAADDMEHVLEAYSIFQQQAPRDTVIRDASVEDSDADRLADAAKQIALSRLKDRGTGRFLSVKQRKNESDASSSVWDVLCEGENDFGLQISDRYTVYFRFVDGQIVEEDPAE